VPLPKWASRKRRRIAAEVAEAPSELAVAGVAEDAAVAEEAAVAERAEEVPGTDGAETVVRPRRWTYRALIAAGLLIILAVGGFQLYATLWTRHSQEAGRALVHQFLKDQSLNGPVNGTSGTGGTALSSCASASKSNDAVKGLLEIPKLGVTAPVEDGQDNAQLDVAVGHNAASVWPGAVGNSVLAAHNVSYFVGLSNLNVGDTIIYLAPCSTTVFQVTGHTIVDAGAPVYNTPTPTITLVTCWPTNALWFTPQRYLVMAREVRQTSRGGGGTVYASTSKPPTVPVPPELAAQGVTLTTYSLPMGSFTLSGTPDPGWAQSTNPLLAEDAAVEAYIAGVRSMVENRLDWWKAFAPGVAAPEPLLGASNPAYLSPLNVTVSAAGTEANTVTLTNTIAISGGKAPGHYAVTVTATIANGVLTISGWSLQPA
jgi:LPXTG-site transpeptidase (sortase) family protein